MDNLMVFEFMGVLLSIVSIAFVYFTFRRNQKADDGQGAREIGTMLTEIGYIKSQVDALNRKLEHYDERYTHLAERISAVEQHSKSAHHRIDEIMEGVVFKDE